MHKSNAFAFVVYFSVETSNIAFESAVQAQLQQQQFFYFDYAA